MDALDDDDAVDVAAVVAVVVVARDVEEEEAGATCKTFKLSLASGTKEDRNTGKKSCIKMYPEIFVLLRMSRIGISAKGWSEKNIYFFDWEDQIQSNEL